MAGERLVELELMIRAAILRPAAARRMHRAGCQLACESSEMRHMLAGDMTADRRLSKAVSSNIESPTCALARSLASSSLLR